MADDGLVSTMSKVQLHVLDIQTTRHCVDFEIETTGNLILAMLWASSWSMIDFQGVPDRNYCSAMCIMFPAAYFQLLEKMETCSDCSYGAHNKSRFYEN